MDVGTLNHTAMATVIVPVLKGHGERGHGPTKSARLPNGGPHRELAVDQRGAALSDQAVAGAGAGLADVQRDF